MKPCFYNLRMKLLLTIGATNSRLLITEETNVTSLLMCLLPYLDSPQESSRTKAGSWCHLIEDH